MPVDLLRQSIAVQMLHAGHAVLAPMKSMAEPDKHPPVWTCSCGDQLFFLTEDNLPVCNGCRHILGLCRCGK